MGKELDRWHKAGRFITGIVVICFFLPFFGVSCAGMDVVTMSGVDMAAGCKPGGLLTEGGGGRGGDDMSEIKIDKVPIEPLAIVALVLVIGAAGFAWVRTRKAVLASLVLSIAAIGALAGLFVKVNGDLNAQVDDQMKKKNKATGEAGELGREVDKVTDEIDAGGRMGLWGAFLFLAASAALAGMALRDRTPSVVAGGPPPGPPPGYPPQGYPPPG